MYKCNWGIRIQPLDAKMFLLSAFVSAALATQGYAAAAAVKASSFAGATSTFQFPPLNALATASLIDSFFPDASVVGFPGATPTLTHRSKPTAGDEAAAAATAPAPARVHGYFPLNRPDTSDHKKKFDVVNSWANLSPMQSVKSFGLDEASEQIPEGCKLNQVFLVHRHGARYPTGDASPAQFATAVNEAAGNGTFVAGGPLAFLNTWNYKLGAEILTPFGREQLFELGVGFRVKYGKRLAEGLCRSAGLAYNFRSCQLAMEANQLPPSNLLTKCIMFCQGFDENLERMVDSALHFAAGFFGVQSYQNDYHQVIEIEADGFNTTLAPYDNCPNANNEVASLGTNATLKWNNVYLADAQKRLQAHLPGFNLTIPLVSAMQFLCPYETVALGYSAFCDLFTEEEWKGFAYSIDLDFWYTNGPGNPALHNRGVGYVHELISRLTQTRITSFDSTVNASIVSSNITFPLNQPIFVDATHDTVITAILTAMNFTSLAAEGPLPLDHIPKKRSYIVEELAPFGSRLVGQVLSCPASDKPTHIRWILNDAVLPQTGIGKCKYDCNGLCELDTFINGMKQRVEEIDFLFDCFGNYTVSLADDAITTGQFPK
ncbi:hypothetical protein D9757_001686 [Collybiopsis confluens]|uniref:Phosphoglycerate mutase-like protein n=1 Tax=Collybiopsis confluens TaxID=2823264 RepID=A0A8H5HYS6_9AGAR|nr:hypothetical protein D9757_001686 [Collybiopsis confluens]